MYTPVSLPRSRVASMRASSSACHVASSTTRCCGSIALASRGLMPKNSGSNWPGSSMNPPIGAIAAAASGEAMSASSVMARSEGNLPEVCLPSTRNCHNESAESIPPGNRHAVPTITIGSLCDDSRTMGCPHKKELLPNKSGAGRAYESSGSSFQRFRHHAATRRPRDENNRRPAGEARMLSMTDVVRTYHLGNQVIRALDGVTVRIDPGQFVAVVGPSGAGKSTMLHLLGALDRPDSGSIRFRDEEIGSLGDDAQSRFRRRNIGFVFQFFNLLPTLSAWENVAVPMLLDGGRLRTARPRALELLATVGLADRAEHRPA